MRIFSASQIRIAEKMEMEKHQINSDMLMEWVADALFNWIESRFPEDLEAPIHLFCGIGNNGGDGMALARLLLDHGFDIKVHIVNFSDKRSKEFLLNMERLKQKKHWPEILNSGSDFPEIGPEDIVVDAIFGVGLNRAPEAWVGRLIEHINASEAFVLSVDLPSGLPMERPPWNPSHVIRADVALGIQWPKLLSFLPEMAAYAEDWDLLDVGMDPEVSIGQETDFELIESAEIFPLYRFRSKFSHKGDYGHSLIIGGSHGKIGAIQLAASACLVTGSGMVTAHVPECGYQSLQTAQPEIMLLTDQNEKIVTKVELPFVPTAIGIGMGMGTDVKTVKAFAALLKETNRPMVIDADALNILAAHPEMLDDLPADSILTPHPKELERLIGPWKDGFDKLEKARAFALKYKLVLVVKGAHSITFYGKRGYINSTGNPGMATAGSGDVLAGMLTALLAQGYPSLDAAIFGVYQHGLAGDLCAMEHGFEAVRASGIVKKIGNAFTELYWNDWADGQDGFDDEFDGEFDDD